MAFSGCTVLLVGSLNFQPYCASCGVYRKRKLLAAIPADELCDIDENASGLEQQQAILDGATKACEAIKTVLETQGAEAMKEHLAEFGGRSELRKRPTGLSMDLHYCPSCFNGNLDARVIIRREISTRADRIMTAELPPEATEVLARKK